jgi:hypothetical protein
LLNPPKLEACQPPRERGKALHVSQRAAEPDERLVGHRFTPTDYTSFCIWRETATSEGLPGGPDQFGRPVDAFDGITSAREFAGISACSTAAIEKHCARKDTPLTQPGDDRGALLTDRTVDQEIERPRVTVKRTAGLLGDGNARTV